jgi:hypothetical protein
LGIAAFDRAGLWELDQTTSCVAWLRQHAGMSAGAASSLTRTGRIVSAVPALVDAWLGARSFRRKSRSRGQVSGAVREVGWLRHVAG